MADTITMNSNSKKNQRLWLQNTEHSVSCLVLRGDVVFRVLITGAQVSFPGYNTASVINDDDDRGAALRD